MEKIAKCSIRLFQDALVYAHVFVIVVFLFPQDLRIVILSKICFFEPRSWAMIQLNGAVTHTRVEEGILSKTAQIKYKGGVFREYWSQRR